MTIKKALPYKSVDPPDPPAFITLLLICALPFFMAKSPSNCFSPDEFVKAVAMGPGGITNLLGMMFSTQLAQLSAWTWALNGFFIWCFGHVIEKKMKALYYIAYVPLVIISGATLLFVTGHNSGHLYIGPSMMLFGLLGGYFAYLPKKHFEAQQWVRPNTEIFRNEKEKAIHERYWVSPWLYITAFVIFEVVLQCGLMFGKDAIVDKTHMEMLGQLHTLVLGNMIEMPLAFQPVGAIINIGVGFALAMMLPKLAMGVKPVRPGGKLQLEVLQHYRELRTLDMTHEQACEGAARFAAVPIDIAKDWISKGSAGLKDQDMR